MMSTHATGTFKVKNWKEKPYNKIEGGAKLTRATVTQTFRGDIKGEGAVEFLMAHRADKSAKFVGIQYITGRIGDRSGGFALQVTGTFEGGVAKGRWTVIPGLGTDDLTGLRGKGSFEAPMGPDASFVLEYTFATKAKTK